MIQVRDLTKIYEFGRHKHYALNGVSFDIKDKEFVVILGECGSGKTTLLNIISGLEKPSGGSVKHDGQEILTLSDEELLKFRRDKTVYVFYTYFKRESEGDGKYAELAKMTAKVPKTIFCDEPTEILDEAKGRHIFKYLVKLQKKRGLTVIVVTHNPNVADIATKVIKLNNGEIVEIKENKNPASVDDIGWTPFKCADG